MVKLLHVFAILAATTVAAPSQPFKRAADVPIPAALSMQSNDACNPNGYTCAQCTDCCVLEFTTAPTNGCAALATPQNPIFDVYKPNENCRNLLIGMYAAKVKDCTGYFEGCILWSELNCKGVQDTLYNNGGNCRTPFLIKSVHCYGSWPPELGA